MRGRTREIKKRANNKANGAKCYKNTFLFLISFGGKLGYLFDFFLVS